MSGEGSNNGDHSMAFVQREISKETFDHTYQGSYTHGLEKIYTLENIDVKSIRKISDNTPPIISKQRKKTIKKAIKPTAKQLEFTLDPTSSFQNDTFLFQEPIQVLMLPLRLEKELLDQKIKLLGDLVDSDHQKLVPLTKIGQGHLDDIQLKLQQYLQEQMAFDAPKINYTSWLKTLLADLPPLKWALVLEAFDIPPFLPLSQGTRVEMRKLSNDKRSLLLSEALKEVQKPEKKAKFQQDVQKITNVYIRPWLRKRASFANLDELKSYLRKLSGFDASEEKILDLLSTIYCDQLFPFASNLCLIENDIYCADEITAKAFKSVVDKTHSYFYKSTLHYSISTLLNWIVREFAKIWQSFPAGFLERVLRLSEEFRVRKNESEELIVRLS